MQTLKLIKKYEKYPEYKDSGIEWVGQIPSQWSIMPMRSIAIENTKKNNNGECQNLLSLSYGKIIEKDITSNEGLLPESFNTYQIISNGNIVFRLTDLQNDKKSLRVGYVDNEGKGIITSAYLAIILNKEISSKFAYYLLHSYDLQKVYYGMGGGVRQTLDFSNFKYLPIIAPEIKEQEKIAKYLDEKTALIDQIIEKKEKQIELLKEKRTAVINQAVTKGLDMNVEMVDSSIEYIGEIPKSWKMRKIFHLFNIIGSGTTPDEKYLTESDDGIPWVNTGDLTDSYIKTPSKKVVSEALKDISTLRLYSENAIVIAMYGATIGKLGIPQFKFCSNQACCILEKPTKDTLEKYIYYWLLGNKKNIVELGVGGGQPNINKEIVKSLKVSIPNISEQEKIILYLDKVVNGFDQTIKIVETSIDKLKEFKTSLISNVVTGKIKV